MQTLLTLCVLSAVALQATLGGQVDIKDTIEVPDEDVAVLPFSEGINPFFKILNELDGNIYIGAKNTLVIYNPLENNVTEIIPQPVPLKEAVRCSSIVEDVEKDCQHFIRVAERLDHTDTTNTLLVCGTNQQEPACNIISIENGSVSLNISHEAQKKVQYSLNQNTTALLHGGNLFVGHREASQANPAHISKFSVNNETAQLTLIAETNDIKENFVNEPDFVGKPFVHGNFIYFFYRETAVEAVNQGKFVYSRVGRLCLDDVGPSGSDHHIQSFFKARLNCSLLGDYPFYFNHIQDIVQEGDTPSETIFYAVFTTTPHGPSSSAVCAYRLSDIIYVFENSKFKGKEEGKLPSGVIRPNYDQKFVNCDLNSLGQEERDFQGKNNLMDDFVPNYNQYDKKALNSDPPLFYSTRMNFYSIAVDWSNAAGKIFYVGTETGTIVKAYFDGSGLKSFEREISAIKHPVTGLRYHNGTQTLLAMTEQGMYRINLATCSAACRIECEELHHGYCQVTGAGTGTACKPIRNGPAHTFKNNVRILSLDETKTVNTIKSCSSRKVELTCEVKGSPICGSTNLMWRFKNKGLVACEGNYKCVGNTSTIAPFVKYREIARNTYFKLVHLSIDVFKDHTEGNFTCSAGDGMQAVVDIQVDKSAGCLTKDGYDERNSTNTKLTNENDLLKSSCPNVSTVTPLESSSMMFQHCSQCPGKVNINAGNN